MPPTSHEDATTAAHLVDACRDIASFLEDAEESGFRRNSLLISAVCFKFAVLGEATRRLSGGVQARFPHIPWRNMRGMRNRIVHGYDDIDLAELWRTAKLDVPVLLHQLGEIQEQINSER